MTLPDGPSLDDDATVWTAAYSKPRQEKALAWDLCHSGVPYFLPMIYRETSSGGRRRRNLYPMFKSYIFCAGDEAGRLAALRTRRTVSFIPIKEAGQGIFRREIAALELGLRTAPTSIELYPRLVEGASVRVTAGPMAGVEGVILDSGNKTRLLLRVTLMGAGATVEIHPDLVEPCDPSPIDSRPTVEVVYDIDRRRDKGSHGRAATAAR